MPIDQGGKTKNIHRVFYFKKKYQEVVDMINKEYPISLKFNEDLIERIHAKYPVISKIEVALIIKAFFTAWRNLLILGEVLTLQGLFSMFKILFYSNKDPRYEKKPIRLKCQMITPANIRKKNG